VENYLNCVRADVAMGATGSDLYTGGTFVAHYNDTSFNSLLDSAWTVPFDGADDLAFNLNLAPVVPEPASWAVFI